MGAGRLSRSARPGLGAGRKSPPPQHCFPSGWSGVRVNECMVQEQSVRSNHWPCHAGYAKQPNSLLIRSVCATAPPGPVECAGRGCLAATREGGRVPVASRADQASAGARLSQNRSSGRAGLVKALLPDGHAIHSQQARAQGVACQGAIGLCQREWGALQAPSSPAIGLAGEGLGWPSDPASGAGTQAIRAPATPGHGSNEA